MKKIKKNTFIIICENQINEKEIFAEIKTKFGNIAPLINVLNKTHKTLHFEYVSKKYFTDNKEHYSNVIN